MIPLPIVDPNPGVAGLGSRQNGGYTYQTAGEDPSLVWQGWPVEYPLETDTNQGIILDSLGTESSHSRNNTEGPTAVGMFQNGGATQASVGLEAAGLYTSNPVDEITPAWAGTGPTPYQVDTNVMGPVSGRSEGMNGNTLQPDYNPQGQYGASTGGGTGMHETVTAYYQAQADQVRRDYSAAALFASV